MSVIRISKYYLLIGIPWIIVSVIAVTWMYRVVALEDLKRLTEKNTVMLSRTMANVIWPQIRHMVNATSDHAEKNHDHQRHISGILEIIRTLLDEPIGDLLRGTSIIKLKIFNTEGLTVYSTDKRQTGIKMHPDYTGSVAIKENKTVSVASFKDSIRDFNQNELKDRFVISSYLPLNLEDSDVIDGVIEIYNDATEIHQQINESQFTFASVLFSTLFIIYFLVFFYVRKVDKVVKSNIELAIARDTEKEANQAKSTFLANMSHELRTPLNAIIGYSEIIQENAHDTRDEESLEDSKRIHSAARHLLHLINEVLDISKIEAGQESVWIEYIKLRNLVDDVATLIEPAIQKNNNKLKIDIDSQLDCIKTDSVKLKQIFFNLLSNAAKFTQNGEINLLLKKEGVWLIVMVVDTGLGIKAENIEKVFRPFSQVDYSSTRRFGGTGLGLAITKHYCEMLGGSIEVSSEYKLGTTFTIKLPINLPYDEAAPKEPSSKTVHQFEELKSGTLKG
ncbi:sensor histidine kinase [Kaarinaea lacus]